MLKKWTQINRDWFAKESRLSKASWRCLIESGSIGGKIIMDQPYVEEDHLAASTTIGVNTTDTDLLNLLD